MLTLNIAYFTLNENKKTAPCEAENFIQKIARYISTSASPTVELCEPF